MHYRLLLRRRMTIQEFFDHVQETQAADLVAPPHDVPQEVFAQWVHAFDIPDSGLKSVVFWVKAPHWVYAVGFFVCGIETPGALQLREGEALPLDMFLWQGEVFEALTPQDLQLAEAAVYGFIAAMQGS